MTKDEVLEKLRSRLAEVEEAHGATYSPVESHRHADVMAAYREAIALVGRIDRPGGEE